tara:strand:- start:560 stop:961 length:402 start_codon:yes stop_codon:yes gene_type:complete
MAKEYDSSWDLNETEDGILPNNEDAFDRIYDEWQKRKWFSWLKENLSFPFEVERKEDDDSAYFTDIAEKQPFRLGHKMKVMGIELEDDQYGIILKVRENRKGGNVPLCDVEVTSRQNENFWPVREYVVWFANQ